MDSISMNIFPPSLVLESNGNGSKSSTSSSMSISSQPPPSSSSSSLQVNHPLSLNVDQNKEPDFIHNLRFKEGNSNSERRSSVPSSSIFLPSPTSSSSSSSSSAFISFPPSSGGPKIRFGSRDLETEYLDLAFINETEKLAADTDFLQVSQAEETGLEVTNITTTTKISVKTNRSRHRRDAEKLPLRTIETAIFVDTHLYKRFSDKVEELKKMIFAIMHQVQKIYSFQSMKIPIEIVLVKFQILTGSKSGPDTADGDIDQYLDNFCAWQEKRNRKANHSKQRLWDHALLLTGLDLFKDIGNGQKNKKVLGLAWVNGMCKPHYSCTLNEGSSFEASYVIAHEMGHSLGILHDGRNNNCDSNKYIMSDKTGPGKINWSACSNAYIENFLRKGNGKCLDNRKEPVKELDFKTHYRLPGEEYPPDTQCALALGSNYKAYRSNKSPFNNICRELWCIQGSWVTPSHPALEGSPCGNTIHHKCNQGTCLESKPIEPKGYSLEQLSSAVRSIRVPPRRSSVIRVISRRKSGSSRYIRRQKGLEGFRRSFKVGSSGTGLKRWAKVPSSRTPSKPSSPTKTTSPASSSSLLSSSEPKNLPLMEKIRATLKSLTSGASSFFKFINGS